MGNGPVRFGARRLWVGVGAFVLAGAPVPPAAAQASATEEARPAPAIPPEAVPAPEPPSADLPVIFPGSPAPAAEAPLPDPAAEAPPPPSAAESPPAVPVPGQPPAAVPPAAPPSAGPAPVVSPAPAPAAAPTHAGHAAAAACGAGGEGGEGGEGEGGLFAQAAPDIAYAGRLMLVRGHLAVGMELARAGAWDDAAVHFLHPREEIYGDLREDLRRRRAPGFLNQLDALATRVRRKQGGPGLEDAYRRALSGVDRAWAGGLPQRVRGTPGFVADVASCALRAAADEYQAAIEGGRVANVVEYQDGRGFLVETAALLDRNAAALRAAPNGAAALAELRAALDALRPVWPAARPPAGPVLQPTAVHQAAARFERAALAFR